MGSSETGWTARFYLRRGRTCAPSLTARASGNCGAARPEVAQNAPCCSSMCHGPGGGGGAACVRRGGVYDADPMVPAITVQSGAAEQRSLASRMRGWKDDASGLEQRLKDLETIARSLRRRWWLVGLGMALGITGWAVGAVRTRPGTMVLVGGGGVVMNGLVGIINERGWYRWWLIYGLALLGVLLVGGLGVWFGRGGFAVAFLLAVLPYAFDPGHTVGNFLVLTAALAYLGASYLHDALYGGAGGQTAAGLETVGLITVERV